jgi:hypothetical protein
MKTFLYRLTSLRRGEEDGVSVLSGTHYYHDELLIVIDARDAEHAACALNTKILGTFDRSSEGLPIIYYTSDYYGGRPHPLNHPEGYFYFSLKEFEDSDRNTHPDLEENLRRKITAPPHV